MNRDGPNLRFKSRPQDGEASHYSKHGETIDGAFSPYAVLGLDWDAGPAEIRDAYLRLAKTYHPDLRANDPVAERRFKKISDAYNVLKNRSGRERRDWEPQPRPSREKGYSFSRLIMILLFFIAVPLGAVFLTRMDEEKVDAENVRTALKPPQQAAPSRPSAPPVETADADLPPPLEDVAIAKKEEANADLSPPETAPVVQIGKTGKIAALEPETADPVPVAKPAATAAPEYKADAGEKIAEPQPVQVAPDFTGTLAEADHADKPDVAEPGAAPRPLEQAAVAESAIEPEIPGQRSSSEQPAQRITAISPEVSPPLPIKAPQPSPAASKQKARSPKPEFKKSAAAAPTPALKAEIPRVNTVTARTQQKTAPAFTPDPDTVIENDIIEQKPPSWPSDILAGGL